MTENWILVLTAISLGFFHTLLGPDHYVPFVVMAKTRKWNVLKTTQITILCGLGHILSSVFIGYIGIAFGTALSKLEFIESARGELAGWLLIAFGLSYFVWGMRSAFKNRPHSHLHMHEEKVHDHSHLHKGGHVHVHSKNNKDITPWVLFTIFVFGPCEPLIPVLMYPAAKGNEMLVLLVAVIFGVTTIFTMLSIVMISLFGLFRLSFGKLERFSHALAGFAIFICGCSIQFLGL